MQRGYVLLPLLLGVGIMGVGLNLIWAQSQSSRWKVWRLEAVQLNDERQRLLHYSADYAALYAPGGAGPGHLPCPDTDSDNTRPGPNPPCGRAEVASGKLPDGVNRVVGRVAFSASLSNRAKYTVLNQIVNNPSLSISIGRWPSEHRFSPTQAGYAQLTSASGQSRLVTKAELAPLTFLWVRAWFVTQLMASKFGHCETLPAHSSQIPSDSEDALLTRRGVRVLAVCEQSDSAESLAENSIESSIESSAESTAVIPHATASSNLEVCNNDTSTCLLRSQSLINWWLGVDAIDWEGVPLTRHWFIANDWYLSAEFSWQRQCQLASVTCELVLDSNYDGLRLDLVAVGDASAPSNTDVER